MAFLTSGSTILSFAEYQDVLNLDQRLFDENEGLTDEVVEDFLIRSTERILTQLKTTSWYRTLALANGASALTIPDLSASKIKTRRNDFTDLCCFYALYMYVLPKIADFSTEENAERVKIEVYRSKYSELLDELLKAGDWYDYDASGSVGSTENKPAFTNYQRVR